MPQLPPPQFTLQLAPSSHVVPHLELGQLIEHLLPFSQRVAQTDPSGQSMSQLLLAGQTQAEPLHCPPMGTLEESEVEESLVPPSGCALPLSLPMSKS